MHTNAEARKLWCPMVRLIHEQMYGSPNAPDSYNRVFMSAEEKGGPNRIGIPTTSRCIAGECAMWRWSPLPKRKFWPATHRDAQSEANAGARPLAAPDDSTFIGQTSEEDAGWWESDAELMKRRTGHCGLAGLPIAG